MHQLKIDEQIKKNLFSANTDVVISAIETIKNKGNKLYLPILFDLLNSLPEPEIEREIMDVLETVKDKEAVNSFMRAIEDDKYKQIRKSILIDMWMNCCAFQNVEHLEFLEMKIVWPIDSPVIILRPQQSTYPLFEFNLCI